MGAKDITSQNFKSVIHGTSRPILIDFWASWCGPCRALSPIIRQLSDELEGQIDIYSCNVDKEPKLASKFHIASIPTLVVIRNAKIVHTMVGTMPKRELLKELKPFL